MMMSLEAVQAVRPVLTIAANLPDDRYILYGAIAALWLRNRVLEDRWLTLKDVLNELTAAITTWTGSEHDEHKDVSA